MKQGACTGIIPARDQSFVCLKRSLACARKAPLLLFAPIWSCLGFVWEFSLWGKKRSGYQ